jgi:hypothetical protein
MLADDPLGTAREDPRLPLDGGYSRAFAAIAADANQFLAVAERHGAVVGTLQLTFIPACPTRVDGGGRSRRFGSRRRSADKASARG